MKPWLVIASVFVTARRSEECVLGFRDRDVLVGVVGLLKKEVKKK